ncbi:MAG: cell division protein FtsA [Campylobacteraceae bacterium]|nr:cell division protein FtsA [Campylobacteraceae bacterium]
MSKTLLALDIGSSSVTAVIAKNDMDLKINILGTGTEDSSGINKGSIVNIEEAANSIRNAISKAKRSTSNQIETTVVSVSGVHTKGIRSIGSVNVTNGIITQKEINQVLQIALYNATMIPEYEVLHVIPISFKVDDSSDIENPLNMNGARLEVSVYISTVKKTALTNIRSALSLSQLEVNTFVLDSYATALSVLDDQQKNFGAIVVNMGDTTTEVLCYKGSSIIFSDFVPVGSNHITTDLSVTLHTPENAAEMLKIKYGNLEKNFINDDLAIKKVKIPRIGDDQSSNEISLDTVKTLIHARVEELLVLIKNKIMQSGIEERIGAGLVITGGMSELKGIKNLASLVFPNMPIKISNPINIKNGYMNFEDATMSTTVGLLFYALQHRPCFELDSNKRIIEHITVKNIAKSQAFDLKEEKMNVVSKETEINKISIAEDNNLLPKLSKKEKGKGLSVFWNKISEWF